MSKFTLEDIVSEYIENQIELNQKLVTITNKVLSNIMTLEQLNILRYLKKYPFSTTTKLAGVFQVKKSAITSLTNKLYQSSFIIREYETSDRRLIKLSLSDKGSQILTQVEKQIANYLNSVIDQFSSEDIQTYFSNQRKFIHYLSEKGKL